MVTNIVKEEFKDIESHDGGGLNLTVERDTQSSRKRFYWEGREFFLTFGFKDVFCLAGHLLGPSSNMMNLFNSHR